MATSDQSEYYTDVKVYTRTARCSPCFDEGNNKPAGHYCVDCKKYFCGKCFKVHNKRSATKSHQVHDTETSTSMSSIVGDTTNDVQVIDMETPPRCLIHQDKLIDTFCTDHGEVCCETCTVVKHSLCSIQPIEKASKGLEINPDANKCKDALIQVLIQLKAAKEKRADNIDHVEKRELDMIESVDEYEQRLIARVKELANVSRKMIRSSHENHKTALDTDVAALNVSIITVTDYANKLGQTGNQPLLFTTVHTGKVVLSDANALLQTILIKLKDREKRYHLDKTLMNAVSEMKSLGSIGDENDASAVTEYKAKFKKNVKVKQGNEYKTQVFDICVMDSGEILVTDFHHSKLKRFSSDLKYTDEIPILYYPVAICKLGNHEAAVKTNSKTIRIVSVGQSMQVSSSMDLADSGSGLAYDRVSEEILACENKEVSVYSKNGSKLRTYDKDANFEPMFTNCKHIALSEDTNDIYVTDSSRGLIVLDKQGNLKMTVPMPDHGKAWSLCLLPGRNVLIGCYDTGKHVQIGKDGKHVGTIIDTNNKRLNTYCAVYDRHHSRLLVGGYPSLISVYTLSTK